MLLLTNPSFPNFVKKKFIQISCSIGYIFEKLLKHVMIAWKQQHTPGGLLKHAQ
jgi:hypothetical protein